MNSSHIIGAVAIALAAASAGYSDCVPHWDNAIGLPGMNGAVNALALVEETESAAAVYAAGEFTTAGGFTANNIARWDGQQWSNLAGGTNGTVRALAVANGGGPQSGQVLYVGGSFGTVTNVSPIEVNNIAMWDPASAQWSALSTGTNGVVRALAIDDTDGQPVLHALGVFSMAGGVAARHIARWDGQKWSALHPGTTVHQPCSNSDHNCAQPQTMIFFDDGSGPTLYVGGTFDTAGGVTVNNIAKWDGEAWSDLSGGTTGDLDGSVQAMAVFDDGSGPALYVGGGFEQAGGVNVNGIARWDGQQWSAVGSGIDFGFVFALEVFDDGSGPALYAAGFFNEMDGSAVNRIAKWNGPKTGWSALDGGVSGGFNMVFDLAAVNAPDLFPGGDPTLLVGGSFTATGAGQANRISAWRGCAQQCPPADLNCDGGVDGTDLLILLGAWGECADPDDCPADLNGDGTVDGTDLLILLGNWG